jgi:cytochrome b pre-mRNA-processing protein 3
VTTTLTFASRPDPTLNLTPTFGTWSQIGMLHMYLINARLRCMKPDEASDLPHQFVNNFFLEAERIMIENHGMTSGAMRQKYLKDLFVQWRGIIAAYDEGLLKGDAVLASAVWRNLFKAREDVDMRVLAAIVSWMRLNLQKLERLSDLELFRSSGAPFHGSPKEQLAVVDIPARALREASAAETSV